MAPQKKIRRIIIRFSGLALLLASSAHSCTAQEDPSQMLEALPLAGASASVLDEIGAVAGQIAAPAAQDSGQVPVENPKRILGIIPNFDTANNTPQDKTPLTTKEKYILAYHQSFDFSAHLGNAFQSALTQASNEQPHYGQGWGAFAERFGATEADGVTSSFLIYAIFPQILHEDPRYFRRGRGPILHRIAYAASRTVITRTDDGGHTANVPLIAGLLVQQAISVSYYPPVDRTASGVFGNWMINLGYTAGYTVLKEFYPDFLHIIFRRKD